MPNVISCWRHASQAKLADTAEVQPSLDFQEATIFRRRQLVKKRVRPNTKKMLAEGTADIPKLSQMMELVSEIQRDATDTFDVGGCSAEFNMILATAIELARANSSPVSDEVRALHHLPAGIPGIRQQLSDRLRQFEMLLSATSDAASRRKAPRLPKQLSNKRYKEILQRPLSSVSARKRPILALLKQQVQLDQLLMCLEGIQTGKREVAEASVDWVAFVSTGISYGIAIGWAAAELRHRSAISDAAASRQKKIIGGHNSGYRAKDPTFVKGAVAEALRQRYQFGLSWSKAFKTASIQTSTNKQRSRRPHPSRVRSYFLDEVALVVLEIESASRVNTESAKEVCCQIAKRMSTDDLSVNPQWVQKLYADWRQNRLPGQKSSLWSQWAAGSLSKQSLAELRQMEELNIMASGDLLRIALLASTKSGD